MRRRNRILLSIFFPALLGVLLTSASAQSDRLQAEEIEDYYRKWLDEDVVYIISPEEKSVFESLSTLEEKDHFIEQFWNRRDPDPRTPVNEFKEEHYRRIAYANEKFHSGIAGWRSDRGMIYIMFGPPDGTEKHPEGGTYQRKVEEGGGRTYTYPFEVWFYRHVEGVGPGIEIEFVDASRTNEYRIAMDPEQKDALFTIPGAGLTLAEQMGTMSRIDRIRTRSVGDPTSYRNFDSATRIMRYRDYPLQRLETLYRLQRGPAVKYKDLEQMVTSRITYSDLPVHLLAGVMRYSDTHSLVPVTLFLDNKELDFQPVEGKEDVLVARLGVYGQVQTLGGSLAYTFEDDIERQTTREELSRELTEQAVYQKRFPLEPGRYKLSLVVQDLGSGKVAAREELLVVPRPKAEELETSSVILTKQLTALRYDETLADPFVVGKYRVVPCPDNRFRPEEQFAQAYFEVYNLSLDQASLEPSYEVEIALEREGKPVFPFTRIDQEVEFDADRLLVYKTIPFQGLIAGSYDLRFKVTDLTLEKSVNASVDFVIE